MNSVARWIGAFVAAVVCCNIAFAHPAVRCVAQLYVNSKGKGSLTLRFDVLSFLLNEQPMHASDTALWSLVDGSVRDVETAIGDAEGRLQRHIIVRVDGHEIATVMRAFPTGPDFERWKQDVRAAGEKPRLPWMADATLSFEVPRESAALDVRFPEVLGDLVLAFEVLESEASAIPLRAGEQSPEIVLSVGEQRMVGAEGKDEQESERSFAAFVRMGVEHIVPRGLDHMLFILGLYLASPRVRSLLILVTTFTLAHSVTLALAATGLVVAPPRVIEPLIALSIVAVAMENIVTRSKSGDDGHPRKYSIRQDAVRAGIVFVFGLVHGLGFASAFEEMELPRSVLVPALVGFNVGVEVGQLFVLCGAFVLVGWAAKKTWYRRGVVIPGSAVIACVGLYWAVTRLMG